MKQRENSEIRLRIYRIIFAGLLTVSIAAFTQLLQAECTDASIMRTFLQRLLGSTYCLDGPLTLSLFCFAVAIPGLAANIITLTAYIDHKDAGVPPEIRVPGSSVLRAIFESVKEGSRSQKQLKSLRALAILTAQFASLLGIFGLFWHFSLLVAVVFLVSAVVTLILTMSYITELERRHP